MVESAVDVVQRYFASLSPVSAIEWAKVGAAALAPLATAAIAIYTIRHQARTQDATNTREDKIRAEERATAAAREFEEIRRGQCGTVLQALDRLEDEARACLSAGDSATEDGLSNLDLALIPPLMQLNRAVELLPSSAGVESLRAAVSLVRTRAGSPKTGTSTSPSFSAPLALRVRSSREPPGRSTRCTGRTLAGPRTAGDLDRLSQSRQRVRADSP